MLDKKRTFIVSVFKIQIKIIIIRLNLSLNITFEGKIMEKQSRKCPR